MSGRRVLVIGSQCKKLKLAKLPARYRCPLPQIDDGPGPWGMPRRRSAIRPDYYSNRPSPWPKPPSRAAYDAAAQSSDTLILAYIGHGEFIRDDFFLMPTDAASPPTSDEAIHLAQLIKDRPAHSPNGLIVLLDTCHSGAGAWDAGEYWVRSLEGRLPFRVLTATDDRATAHAWFTQSLIQLLERGDPATSNQIRCVDARSWVLKAHP